MPAFPIACNVMSWRTFPLGGGGGPPDPNAAVWNGAGPIIPSVWTPRNTWNTRMFINQGPVTIEMLS